MKKSSSGPTANVLIIYTGGTVGSVPKNAKNVHSPLIPGTKEELVRYLPVDDDKVALDDGLVKVTFRQTNKLIDSTNIKPLDWIEIAGIVAGEYDKYDGFVVLHGTDTMAYTASVLSFMFKNLQKPVIVTGSQRPIGRTRQDAQQNLVTAIEYAAAGPLGKPVVPEVCVFFRDSLLRGCRVTKASASGYHGFKSHNLPPLGMAGEHVLVNEDLARPWGTGKFDVRKGLNTDLAVIELSPLMGYEVLRRILCAGDLSAVILKTYGTGNAPSDSGFLDIVAEAITNHGVKVVDVTQCGEGTVELGLYDVSAGLLERGVITGLDMTSEAAQAKLAVLLADEDIDDSVETLMQINLRGEQSQSLFDVRFAGGAATPQGTVRSERFPGQSYFAGREIRRAMLRILGFRVPGVERATLPLTVFFNEEKPSKETSDRFVEIPGVEWDVNAGPVSVFADVTAAVVGNIESGRKARITVVSDTGMPVEWSSLSVAIFTD